MINWRDTAFTPPAPVKEHLKCRASVAQTQYKFEDVAAVKKIAMISALLVLALLGMVSLYQTLYDLWMCAHPVYKSIEWQELLYVHVAITLLIASLWLLTVWRLFMQRNRTNPPKSSP